MHIVRCRWKLRAANWEIHHPNCSSGSSNSSPVAASVTHPSSSLSQPPPHLLAQQAKFTPAPFVPQRTHRSETLHPRRSSLQSNASIIPSNSPQQQRPPLSRSSNLKANSDLLRLRVGPWGNITGPQLVSTSSRMRTIPIDDIRRDLMASGKWN
ncbi:hypothetical protein BASA61_002294, partial [Batrachochytrium salamandrivorans]